MSKTHNDALFHMDVPILMCTRSERGKEQAKIKSEGIYGAYTLNSHWAWRRWVTTSGTIRPRPRTGHEEDSGNPEPVRTSFDQPNDPDSTRVGEVLSLSRTGELCVKTRV